MILYGVIMLKQHNELPHIFYESDDGTVIKK